MDDVHVTKQRLLEAGLRLMLARGYHALGVQGLLEDTGIPKGSFYHHFESKEAFAMEVVDLYQSRVHDLLHDTLADGTRAPLERIRTFFERVAVAYAGEGYLGCLLGSLGQELSGANDRFRLKIQACIEAITARLADCFEEASLRGELPEAIAPRAAADMLVSAWEGAALRSRLAKGAAPLHAVLEFYFASLAVR